MTQGEQKKLPKGWQYKKLGELAHFINGAAFKPEDWHETGKPIIRIQNLNNSDKLMNLTGRILDEKYLVESGDLLVSWSASLDVFIWKGEQSWLNQHIFKVIPFPSVDRIFLYYILKEEIQNLLQSSHLHGATMKHINRGPFLAHTVPLPPLAEQKHIVARLDKQLAAVEKARLTTDKQVEATTALPAAFLRETFASKKAQKWPRARLGEVCEIVNGTTPKSSIDSYWNGDIVWITPMDLGKLKEWGINSSVRKITKKGFKSCGLRIVPKGTVVLSSRAPIGYLGITNIPLCTNQGCKSFIPTGCIISEYLYLCLKINMDSIKKLGTGATFPEVSKLKLQNFTIPLPPLTEQKRIVALLDRQFAAVKKADLVAEKQQTAISMLPDSLLQQAFSGDL